MRLNASTQPRRHPKRPRLGLRTRLTLTYALGAALLSAILSVITFGLTRENLLNQREESAVAQVLRNATTISRQLPPTAGQEEITQQVDSLPRPDGALPVLRFRGRWYNSSLQFGNDAIPADMRQTISDGEPARMRTEVGGAPVLIVGVPIPGLGAEYYEGASLDEMQTTLEGLGISLLGASILTTIGGGLLGFWAARRVFRPMLDVGRAADAIAGGALDTRLPTGSDPDLDRLANPFNDMAQALQDRIERDARFASEVSHELRSPLMTLAASVEVLENARDDLPERGRTALDLLSADVDRFQQLVEDLLEISRFDVGAIKLHLEEVLVTEMVIQAVSVVGGSGVPIRYPEDVDEVVVRIDKRRIGRVLANLLDNAARYAGGATAVTVERVGDRVQIAVEDRGNGVSEEEREVIFDRFSRGSEGGNRSSDSGVGLGLALVDEHVRLHGGRAWVEDRHDGLAGARFVVELPIVATAAEEPAHDEPVPVPG